MTCRTQTIFKRNQSGYFKMLQLRKAIRLRWVPGGGWEELKPKKQPLARRRGDGQRVPQPFSREKIHFAAALRYMGTGKKGLKSCRKQFLGWGTYAAWPELYPRSPYRRECQKRVTFGYSLFPNSSFPGSFCGCVQFINSHQHVSSLNISPAEREVAFPSSAPQTRLLETFPPDSQRTGWRGFSIEDATRQHGVKGAGLKLGYF